jgi:hypothetical protein
MPDVRVDDIERLTPSRDNADDGFLGQPSIGGRFDVL